MASRSSYACLEMRSPSSNVIGRGLRAPFVVIAASTSLHRRASRRRPRFRHERNGFSNSFEATVKVFEPFFMFVDNPYVMVVIAVDLRDDRAQLGVQGVEPRANPRVGQSESCVDGVQARIDGIEPFVDGVEPLVDGLEPRVDSPVGNLESLVDSMPETGEPFVHSLVKS